MTAGGPPPDPPPSGELPPPGEWQLDVEPVEGEAVDLAPVLLPEAEPAPASVPSSALRPPPSEEVPPSPEQLVEAMLFVGGHPLTPAVACSAVRGLTPERFLVAVDALTRLYRRQRRPYSIQARDNGFVLTLLPSYRSL